MHTKSVFLTFAVLGVAVQVTSPAPLPKGDGCHPVTLLEKPLWTSSGAWSADGSELLVVDARNKRILRYDRAGKPRPLPTAIDASLSQFFPTTIAAQGSNLLIETEGAGNLRMLDKSFIPEGPKRSTRLKSRAKSQSVEGMFLWQPVGSDLVTFSDIHGPRDVDWSSAFVRMPISNPSDFKVLLPVSFDDPAKTFYRIGYPYIASLGDDAYVLVMANKMGIYRSTPNSPGLRPLSAFPANLDLSPPLPSFKTREDFAPLMRAVEGSTMPAGLYGFEGYLYVLSRRPAGGKTQWSMTKIDPRADAVVATASIDLEANHVTVVPGKSAWAFIEKGSVKAFGRQDVRTVVYVDSNLFRNMRTGVSLCSGRSAGSLGASTAN